MPAKKRVPKNPGKYSTKREGLTVKQMNILCQLAQGMSPAEAADSLGLPRQSVSQLMTYPAFVAAYDKILAQNRERAQLAADDLIRELVPILTFDIRSIFNDNHSLKPISEWPEAAGKAISGLENEELFEGRGEDRQHIGSLRKVKLWPKVEAADKLAKLLGAYKPEKVEVIGDFENLLLAARERALSRRK